MIDINTLADRFVVHPDELLHLARQAKIAIEHPEARNGGSVDHGGAAVLQVAVERKRAGWSLLRIGDRVRWQGLSDVPSERLGTVRSHERPGDLRTLVLWDGASEEKWTERATLRLVTKWVKTSSHRARKRLLARCEQAGVEAPTPWFRFSPHPAHYRALGEFWEVPGELSVEHLSGVTVLKNRVPESELIKPWRV